ncbi:MAG TPA: DNA gyrase inhibitor YacG [Acidobacteriaceae bacterium]|jgi:hypothetical protein|nr:DNA gyrase inhibitor YacG [Acidobacteriaceae bacterium]
MAKILYCPICRKEVPLSSPNVPFCSDRCRLIDLGKWASGDYKISSPVFDPDLLEDLQHSDLDSERRAHERSEDED